MAKEEKPLEYQRRIRDTKGVAQRLDLHYLSRPALIAVLRKRLTWVLVAIAAIASVPLVTGFGGSRRAVMSGAVSAAHAVFENKCESCHTTAFASVPDSACQTCHDGAPHPAKSIDTGRAHSTVRCAECHIDHQGRGQLAKVVSGNCTSCHASLAGHATGAKVKDVSSFRAGKHPEFSTASMSDVRPLRLNHAIHMPAAPKTIRGMKLPMKCADCHVTDRNSPTGALLPVTFEQNCKSCHARELEFDVYQTLGPTASPAPHTRDPKTIRDFVAAAYRGRPDAERLVKDAEDYLFNRKCVYCHLTEPRPSGSGRSLAASVSWLARAEFDHRAHRAVGCESCHAAARTSTKTSDVLIPKMESCLPCHGDSAADLDRCSLCHQYHNRSLEKDVERKFGGTR
jgi:mono/diheme cytochrome c family protein